MEALSKLHHTVKKAHQVNPDIKFEVFIHKVDGLSDDHKIETQRDIHQRANEDLMDSGDENILLSFYLTSIYDHSIFEAFSKVVQKLIPQLPTLENLLNIFITVCQLNCQFLTNNYLNRTLVSRRHSSSMSCQRYISRPITLRSICSRTSCAAI